MSASDLKSRVRDFWQANPCGAKFAQEEIGTPEFFEAVERHRYETEWHIPQVIHFEQWRDKDVLEVGCGLGTDAARFARAGARYSGVDLTERSIKLAGQRFSQEGLAGQFQIGDAEQLPFPAASFDLVYSHGVLHHTPDIEAAIGEVRRVLRPGGQAMVMLYHRRSFNYYVNIMLLRRAGIRLLAFDWGPGLIHRITGEDEDRLIQFQRMFRSDRASALARDNFLNNNTDGVGNPLARVFTRREARRLFREFRDVETEVHFLNKRWIPLLGRVVPASLERRLARLLGWHLWAIARK
jgi:ubiquinone/menaquinone biosynthesis C-methylase UbiE